MSTPTLSKSGGVTTDEHITLVEKLHLLQENLTFSDSHFHMGKAEDQV